MLELTKEEQAWLDAYREALDKKHPGTVQEIIIYGSKARGQARLDSDLDVLLIVRTRPARKKERCDASVTCWPRLRTFYPLFSPTRRKNGRAEREVGQRSVKQSSATRC